MAAILTLGGGTAANAAVASPPADDVSVADSNEAAIDATLATIDDPAQQASVRAWMEQSTADGSEIITAQAGDYQSSGSEGAAQRAYPSGCGLYVLILRNGQKITNDTLTSCVSGPYQFLTHQMRSPPITAPLVHPTR